MTKRKILTGAVILAAVLLIGLILFLSGRKPQAQRFTGGEDTPYPYAWTQETDGTVLVEPSGEVPAGFGWTVTESDPSVAAVSEPGEEGKTGFLLTPAGVGDCFFTLALVGGEDGEEVLCRLYMTVEVTGTKKPRAAVTGHRLEPMEGVLRGGEDFGAPYRIWTGENGDLELRLTDTQGAEDWSISLRTPSTLGMSQLQVTEGRVTAQLYSPAAGEAAFTLYSPSRGLSLEVSCRGDREGNLSASAHEMLLHEDWSGREEGYAAADLVSGAITLPEGAEDVRYGTDTAGGGIGAVSRVEFRYLGYDWLLYVSPSGGFGEVMEEQIPVEEIGTFFIPGGLLAAVFEEGSVLAWCDTEQQGYLLQGSGEGIDRDALMQTASAIMTNEEN